MTEFEVCGFFVLYTVVLISQKGCYVFTPEEANTVSQRPGKRRKINPAKAPAEQNAELLFAPLLKGIENIESTRTRSELFESSWRPKESTLKVHRSSV